MRFEGIPRATRDCDASGGEVDGLPVAIVTKAMNLLFSFVLGVVQPSDSGLGGW